MRKEFPSDWSKLHHTQVRANIGYLLKNYKNYDIVVSGDNENDEIVYVSCDGITYGAVAPNKRKVLIRIGDNIKIIWDTSLESYTINNRLVTSLTGTLYEPLDELFKACRAYYKTGSRARRRNIQALWDDVKPFVLLFGGLGAFFACVYMYVRIDYNYQSTIQEKIKEKLQQEYPDYSGYEERKQQITDSIENCTGALRAWRNRREKGD